jgi:uncharacterized protein
MPRPLPRRHVLSIDDGPFRKFRDREVIVVGVVTAGPDLIEGILVTRLEIDGEGATERLAAWIAGSRFRPVIRAILLGGISIAGLSIVDLPSLAAATGIPAIAVNRKAPRDGDLQAALAAAGLEARIPLIARAGPSRPCGPIHVSCAGIEPEEAAEIVRAEAGRSKLPEGLRLAHLIARAYVLGESRGKA